MLLVSSPTVQVAPAPSITEQMRRAASKPLRMMSEEDARLLRLAECDRAGLMDVIRDAIRELECGEGRYAKAMLEQILVSVAAG